MARDTTGALWLHQGNGSGLAPRKKVGGGWNQYSDLIGGGDTDHDGRNDLIAYNKESVPATRLYVYKGTASWSAPFATRRALHNYPLYNDDPQGLGLGKVPLSIY